MIFLTGAKCKINCIHICKIQLQKKDGWIKIPFFQTFVPYLFFQLNLMCTEQILHLAPIKNIVVNLAFFGWSDRSHCYNTNKPKYHII